MNNCTVQKKEEYKKARTVEVDGPENKIVSKLLRFYFFQVSRSTSVRSSPSYEEDFICGK